MTYDEMRKCLLQLGITAPMKPGSRKPTLRRNNLSLEGTYANAEGNRTTGKAYLTMNTGPRFPKNRGAIASGQSPAPAYGRS